MLRHQWNSLEVGDSVFVHTNGGRLVAATVAFVADGGSTGTADGDAAANTVGVRLDDGDETYYTWPSPAYVHTDPVEMIESCVHCRLLRTLDATESGAKPAPALALVRARTREVAR